MDLYKKCTRCNKIKPLSAFNKQRQRKDGRRSRCRICQSHSGAVYRLTHDRTEYLAAYSQGLKIKAMSYYSRGNPKCKCCGEKHLVFLTLDHIKGGGNQHRKRINKTGKGFYLWIINNNYPSGYRVLCYNCNIAHGMLGYCPHNK